MSETRQSLESIVIDTQQVIDTIIKAQGHITPEIEEMYKQLTTNLITKVDACAFIEKKLESEAEFFKEQAKYYTSIARSLETSRENIRERIKTAMLTLDYKEILGRVARFVLTKAAKKLILEPARLPKEYVTVVQTEVPNRDKILGDLEKGLTIEGATLVENVALRQFANKKG